MPGRRLRNNHQRKTGSFSWSKIKHSPDELSTSDYGSYTSEASLLTESLSVDNLVSDEELDAGVEYFLGRGKESGDTEFSRDTRRTRCLQHKNVTVVIPDDNPSGFSRDEFHLEFIYNADFVPVCMSDIPGQMVHASEIVSVEPHGACFHPLRPALLYLPLFEKVSSRDRVVCLCSNTAKDRAPQWESLPQEDFIVRGGWVIVKASHFSLFTAVIEKDSLEVWKRIGPRGGLLQVPAVPGVEVTFPPGSLLQETTTVLRVLQDVQQMVDDNSFALASPVIMVGPHGYQFNPSSCPVTVKLPVPHYLEIGSKFSAQLSVWESSTAENESRNWRRLNSAFTVEYNEDLNLWCVKISVTHFSFFKVLWDVLVTTMYEAKLGVAYFYPYIAFSMMCQAWMEENKDTQCFGLEVIVYRSDKKLPEATNYRYKVGSSLKPKMVKPGCIVIRLKSELFFADVAAGEDECLSKEEPDFRGREFEKQFALRFKEKQTVEKGTFGKVVVERKVSSERSEPLFEFNLNKTGNESEPVPFESSERWSVVAIKELAGTLQILEEGNWKKFARHIGFTKNEINSKLAYAPDPFLSMVNLYQVRGGTPEEFVQALYEVSRELRVQSHQGSSPSSSTKSSPSSSRWGTLFNLSPRKWRETEEQSESESSAAETETTTSSRKRAAKGSAGSSGSASKRRRVFSDASETMSSSEESTPATESCKNNNRKLVDGHMWHISALMNSLNWRALGRTLGLREDVLLNIEHAYKSTGFRECAYQTLLEWKGRFPQKCTFGTLYSALLKENMNEVAKLLAGMKLDLDDDEL